MLCLQVQDLTRTSLMYLLTYLGALCANIIWKPVACSQQNCFANFCEYCISNHPPKYVNAHSELGPESQPT